MAVDVAIAPRRAVCVALRWGGTESSSEPARPDLALSPMACDTFAARGGHRVGVGDVVEAGGPTPDEVAGTGNQSGGGQGG